MKIPVKIIREQSRTDNSNKVDLPLKGKPNDAGYDVRSNENKTIFIKKGETKLIGTGLKMSIPVGYEIQLRPRSGLSIKFPNYVSNNTGTIDSGYLDEIKVIVNNKSDDDFVIEPGDRIAQIFIKPVYEFDFIEVDSFDNDFDRESGLGGTGVK